VRQAIAARDDLQERSRAGLSKLFDEMLRYADSDEEVPGWSELARRMGTSRATLWDHAARLRDLVGNLVGEDQGSKKLDPSFGDS